MLTQSRKRAAQAVRPVRGSAHVPDDLAQSFVELQKTLWHITARMRKVEWRAWRVVRQTCLLLVLLPLQPVCAAGPGASETKPPPIDFAPALNYSIGDPCSLAPGDFDGDGRVDLAAPTVNQSGAITLLFGRGNGGLKSVSIANGQNVSTHS